VTRLPLPHRRHRLLGLLVGTALLVLAACAPPQANEQDTGTPERPWSEIRQNAQGKQVSLWMWGGDPAGNRYVDEELIPAARDAGVRLRRVPVADTKDAVNRVLAELQAGTEDGDVDLVWVNGDNFATVQQAGGWRCGWAGRLPHAELLDPDDPLIATDFGVDTRGCESPWHKAQFTFVYDSARVADPPKTLDGLLRWAQEHPGRFTYPAPPDFTGSVFLRQTLYATSGGVEEVPLSYDEKTFDTLAPPTYRRLEALESSLWREGETYPRDVAALDQLFADGQVDFTMTYGPATLTGLVQDGTFPETTRVLSLEEGTVGNASFLALPATSGQPEAAMVVANLALSPEQQALKADPAVWGQFTVLDQSRLSDAQRRSFEQLPRSPVVPPYEELSRNANPELSPEWVPALDEGWRRQVLGQR
jgi:putative spermidine/putrescine transport system substrate-binding protein